MGRLRRVLIVDPTPDWRELLTDVFLKENIYVQAVSSVEEALNKLNEDFFHLIILDIQTAKEENEHEDYYFYLFENLKRIGTNNVINVIILTDYVTINIMRNAFRKYHVADFLSKREYDTSTFLENIQRIFVEELRNTFTLDIAWQGHSGSEQAVLNRLLSDPSLNPWPTLRSKVAVELEDLLCQLFFQAERIIVRPLLESPDITSSLLVQPFYPDGRGYDVIIKLGSVKKIEEEYNRYKKYVEPYIGDRREISVLKRTLLLGGIMYPPPVSANDDQWEDFGHFYLHADIQQIEEIFQQLFFTTCRAWYASPGLLQMHNLTEDYQHLFTFEELDFLLSNQLKSVQIKQFLFFCSLTTQQRLFTNPLIACAMQSFVSSTYTCITHGNFTKHNILVDNNKQVWLVDFQHTSPSHILRDICQIDTVIRFHLLRAEDATLDERLAMEDALCSIDRFSQIEQLVDTFTTNNHAILKTYNTVVSLRRLAHKLISSNPEDNMYEYYVALLYNALSTSGMTALSIVQREHALLCASILTERLGLGMHNDSIDDILEVFRTISNRSYGSYQKLTDIIVRRLGALSSTMISSNYFVSGTLWEIVLPEIGLHLPNQKAILLLRQKEVQDTGYRELHQLATDNALILIIDIVDILYSPCQGSPQTIHFSVDTLLEMAHLSQDDLRDWLRRVIVTRTDKNVKRAILPYGTEGAAKLFVGREDELQWMTRLDRRGGIITGAHQSGKSSLLQELGKHLRQEGLHVIGPLMLGGLRSIGFQTFFERTLQDFGIIPLHDMTPETWAAVLRDQSKRGTKPVFLLDEVDDLLNLDAQDGFSLGRQIRSLHHEGHCQFYLAGLEKLRKATHQQYGPFRNFATQFLLKGVTEEESKQLIQRPMKSMGFHINDEQASRVFRGTAGIPYLIQDFCIRLLCAMPYEQASRPDIEDSTIVEIEVSHAYHSIVIEYYNYAQQWDSKCVMLAAVVHKEVSRKKIMDEFTKENAPLRPTRLDEILDFLVEFGIFRPINANLYSVLPEYLYRALLAREPEALLRSLLKSRQEDEL